MLRKWAGDEQKPKKEGEWQWSNISEIFSCHFRYIRSGIDGVFLLFYFFCFFLPYTSSLIVPTGWESNDADGWNKLILLFQNTVPNSKVDIVTIIDFFINQNYIVLTFYCKIFYGKLSATVKPSHLYLSGMILHLH